MVRFLPTWPCVHLLLWQPFVSVLSGGAGGARRDYRNRFVSAGRSSSGPSPSKHVVSLSYCASWYACLNYSHFVHGHTSKSRSGVCCLRFYLRVQFSIIGVYLPFLFLVVFCNLSSWFCLEIDPSCFQGSALDLVLTKCQRTRSVICEIFHFPVVYVDFFWKLEY